MSTSIYLNFPGNTKEVFEYYHRVFETEAPTFMFYGDLPSQVHPDGENMDEGLKKLVIHTELVIFGSKIMAADLPEGYGREFVLGNNFSIAIESDDHIELTRVYKELKTEAKLVEMELGPQFFSPLYGHLVDKFGISWQIIGAHK
jgi:PhnB protein